jgi:hypothetical protein
MDEIAKNMVPNANSAERNPKAQCDIHKENMDHVYILTCKCYRVWHTHLQKMLRVYNLRYFFSVMVNNQMKDDTCV